MSCFIAILCNTFQFFFQLIFAWLMGDKTSSQTFIEPFTSIAMKRGILPKVLSSFHATKMLFYIKTIV